MAERNPNLVPSPRVLVNVFNHLINQWDFPFVSAVGNGRPYATTSGYDLDQLRIRKPRERALASTVRIDRQGDFPRNGKTYINIQGQYSSESVFHVSALADHRFGAAAFQGAMRTSMEHQTSESLDA